MPADLIEITTSVTMLEPILQKVNPSTTPTAEYVIGLLLSLSYQLPEAHQSILNGQWQPETFTGGPISGKTLGIMGFGEVGSQVAAVAQAFGMKVLVYSPSLSDEEAQILGDRSINLDSLLQQSDYITLHLPLTAKTARIINAEALAKMKPTARLINCAHRSLVDEAALAEALETDKIAGAALDVYDTESLRSSPLRNLGNKVILTPHLASHTTADQKKPVVDIAKWFQNIYEAGWQTLESFLQTLEGVANPPEPTTALSFRFAPVRSRSANAENPSANVTAIKPIDWEKQNSDSRMALIANVKLETDQRLITHPEFERNARDILLQLYPIGKDAYLPSGVQLTVLDENGEIFLEAKARSADNWIQLEFRGEPGERFSVKVALNDRSFPEDFTL